MHKQLLLPGALLAVLSLDCAVGGTQDDQEAFGLDAGASTATSGSSTGSSSGSSSAGLNTGSTAGDDGPGEPDGGDDGSLAADDDGDDATTGSTGSSSGSGASSGSSATTSSSGRTHHDAGSGASSGSASSGSASSGSASSGSASSGSASSGSASSGSASSGSASSGSASSGSASSGSTGTAPTTLPAGWLYTSANKVYVSNGSSGGTQWIGRGVNMDDIFFCGYDNTLWMTSPDQTLESVASGLIKTWKPNFVRVSLSMDSYPTVVSWAGSGAQYATPMTNVINALGANPNTYVLITVRSDPSMIGEDTVDGDAEATGLPSDSTTTPNKTKYPTGTDATYVALVDAFANSKFVLFGLTNEPGGNKLSNSQISAAMNHAVGTIRAEEDRLGVPHHIVSVQGNGWTSDLSFYAATPAPITYDNVVYELHYYPGMSSETASSYQYSSTLPMIIGEYGDFTASVTQASFYADMEAKGISNLAWDFEPYSDCAPDLLSVTDSTTLTATTWGSTVQSYLLAH